jgi:hypothetical protein
MKLVAAVVEEVADVGIWIGLLWRGQRSGCR